MAPSPVLCLRTPPSRCTLSVVSGARFADLTSYDAGVNTGAPFSQNTPGMRARRLAG